MDEIRANEVSGSRKVFRIYRITSSGAAMSCANVQKRPSFSGYLFFRPSSCGTEPSLLRPRYEVPEIMAAAKAANVEMIFPVDFTVHAAASIAHITGASTCFRWFDLRAII